MELMIMTTDESRVNRGFFHSAILNCMSETI